MGMMLKKISLFQERSCIKLNIKIKSLNLVALPNTAVRVTNTIIPFDLNFSNQSSTKNASFWMENVFSNKFDKIQS